MNDNSRLNENSVLLRLLEIYLLCNQKRDSPDPILKEDCFLQKKYNIFTSIVKNRDNLSSYS